MGRRLELLRTPDPLGCCSRRFPATRQQSICGGNALPLKNAEKDVEKEVSHKDLDALPEVTKNCGIILDDSELDD